MTARLTRFERDLEDLHGVRLRRGQLMRVDLSVTRGPAAHPTTYPAHVRLLALAALPLLVIYGVGLLAIGGGALLIGWLVLKSMFT
jgi:hypothetical protein